MNKSNCSPLGEDYDLLYQSEKITFPKLFLNRWPRNRYESVFRFINLQPGEKCLDVGCGGGQILNHLKEKSADFYGMEISKRRIKSLSKLFDKEKLIVGDIENYLSEEEIYDKIFLADVLEHTVNRYNAIIGIKRLLKKGGLAIITVPNLSKIKNRLKMLIGRYPSSVYDSEEIEGNIKKPIYDDGYLQQFTFSILRRTFEKYNFRLVKSFGFGRFGKIHNFWPELMSGSICMIFKKN